MSDENTILGVDLDPAGRCKHYHSELDIVSIKFKCCHRFYACIYCHEELTEHKVERWEKTEFSKEVILCGNCKQTLSIKAYISAKACSNCGSKFNPKCENHFHFYFH